jgi:hypothetical protein
MLPNEFLKEHQKVQDLEKQVEKLTAGVQKVSAQLAAASPSGGGLEASKPAPQWSTILKAVPALTNQEHFTISCHAPQHRNDKLVE